MRVFIANFGQENYLWPECLRRSTIAYFEDEDLWPLRLANDREAYVARCLEVKKTAAGIRPTLPVASRWYNLSEVVRTTSGDLWIHRAKDELWWTVSSDGAADVSFEPAFKPSASAANVYVSHKPAQKWSNKSRAGARLDWAGLHAKAREFLFTESTLQKLAPDNAEYAMALIDGLSLTAWHSRSVWKQKSERAGRGAVNQFNAQQRAAVRMARTAFDTAAGANGQIVERRVKSKEFRFPHQTDCEEYVAALIKSQDGLCALTGLVLQYDGEDDNPDLLCSLDRIDSNGHYEPGNLQVVCKFANRWKGDGDDARFRSLIALVKGD